MFQQASGPVKGKVSIQHDALVEQQKLNKLIVHHCLNCDSYVYATGEGANDNAMLINGDLVVSNLHPVIIKDQTLICFVTMQRDQAQLMTMMNCDKYSMPFKVILKPIDALPRVLHVNINKDVRVKSLFDKLQDYIQSDSARTEAEIRRLTTECHQRRLQAEKDFQRIVTLIDSTERSTKSTSTENIDSLTPPVTPESVNDKMMTMDNQLNLPQPMKNNKTVNGDGFAKHKNAIHQQPFVKNISFDDDIFQLDGMQDNSNVQNGNHNNNDEVEDESDDEPVIEKRVYNRGRSGSIARSAPISMPQFNHHVIHEIDTEDGKPATDQKMDIASSIQMLARSIHADSVFGELPARPTLRYNTEF